MAGCQTQNNDNISSSKSSGDIKLTLYADKANYKPNDEIKLWATLEYKGKQNSITLWHDNPFINFYIASKTDNFKWEPLNDALLVNTVINKNEKFINYFPKPINISKKDIESIEDEKMREFVQDPKFHLPKGKYEVKAFTKFSTSKDSKENITLIASLNIKVEG